MTGNSVGPRGEGWPVKEAVRDYFDASVDAYVVYERATGRFTDLTRRLFGAMTDAAGRDLHRVLDAGAGNGVSTTVLADDRSVVALDVSRTMLRANGARARIQGDVDEFPLARASVDAVAFTASRFLVPDLSVAVAEAKRVVRPGGVVGAVEPGGWETPVGDDPFRDLERDYRSPASAETVRDAIAAAFETRSGTWRFATPAEDLRLFHAIPAMAARLYPKNPPARRVLRA